MINKDFLWTTAGYADKFRKDGDQVVFVHVYESPITPPPTFASKNSTGNACDYNSSYDVLYLYPYRTIVIISHLT